MNGKSDSSWFRRMVSNRALIRSSVIPSTMAVQLQLRIRRRARPLKLNPRVTRLRDVGPVPWPGEESRAEQDEDLLECIALFTGLLILWPLENDPMTRLKMALSLDNPKTELRDNPKTELRLAILRMAPPMARRHNRLPLRAPSELFQLPFL